MVSQFNWGAEPMVFPHQKLYGSELKVTCKTSYPFSPVFFTYIWGFMKILFDFVFLFCLNQQKWLTSKLRCSTVWLLGVESRLKLRKKELLPKVSKFTKWQLFSLKKTTYTANILIVENTTFRCVLFPMYMSRLVYVIG